MQEEKSSSASFWKSTPVITGLLAVIAIILLGWALKATFYVSMPLACAFFLAVIVRPLQKWLDDHLPKWLRWLSVACAMLAIVLVAVIVVGAIWLSIDAVSGKFPEYVEKSQGIWEKSIQWVKSRNLPVEEKVLRGSGAGNHIVSFLTGAVKSVWEVLGFLTLVFFLVLLMLLEASDWRKKSKEIFRQSRGEPVVNAVDAVAEKIRQYLFVRTIISAISAIIEGLWLWAMGVDFALVWGLLFFILNYLPNIGSILAGIPPSLLALIQFDLGWALFVIGGLLLIEQVIGNLIDPKIQGRALMLSPFIVLVSMIFWGWVWGIIGAFLAVPITVTIITICSYIEPLKPVAVLLSRASERGK